MSPPDEAFIPESSRIGISVSEKFVEDSAPETAEGGQIATDKYER